MLKQTPSQTIGPFFAYGLTPEEYGKPGISSGILVNDTTEGERIRIHGQVLDGADVPITDALLEIWQADHDGRYHHPLDKHQDEQIFQGFGRRATDENGMYSFMTIKPGCVTAGTDRVQAPHVNLIVLSRGILAHAYTRIYFSDETKANNADPVLKSVDPGRRSTLIARRDESRAVPRYNFDVHLQGKDETVFFDV